MANLDLITLLQAVPGPLPAGRDLDSTLELLDLESAAAEPEESAFKGVETVDARNWQVVRGKAERLLSESKDLRVASIFVRALLHTRGVPGFCEGVAFVNALVYQYWSGLYPALDDGDAVARLNTLGSLWSPLMLSALRGTTLASVRGMGDFSVREVLVARGKDKPKPGAPVQSAPLVQKALESAPDAQATLEALRTAVSALDALSAFIRQELPGESLDPAPLGSVLRALIEAYPDGNVTKSAASAPVSAPSSQPAERVMPSPDVVHRERELQSRDDVIALLDKICDYYATHEPSSPIPLILQRARRLVPMNFLEIIRDLADKGLPQVEAITGKEPKS